MPEANASPKNATQIDANWDIATHTEVEEIVPGGTNIIHSDIPILFVPWTPATITIHHSEYPNGVVILNENDRPGNTNPIQTIAKPELNLEFKQRPPDEALIDITDNQGWPTGRIILWK